MTKPPDNTFEDIVKESVEESKSPGNQELVVRLLGYLQGLKRKDEWAELQEGTLCQRCRVELTESVISGSVITNCLHVFCKECLEHLQNEAAEQDQKEISCPKCEESITDTQSYVDTLCKVGQHIDKETRRKTEGSYKNLEDEATGQQTSGFTVAQTEFLVNSINSLSRVGGDDFQLHLNTMKSKLRDGLYPSIETLKADFDRLEHASVVENGHHHGRTVLARNIRASFDFCMTEYPGHGGEESTARKKTKTARSKTPAAQTPTRAPASSPPRAAKTAMKDRKYPRDHW